MVDTSTLVGVVGLGLVGAVVTGVLPAGGDSKKRGRKKRREKQMFLRTRLPAQTPVETAPKILIEAQDIPSNLFEPFRSPEVKQPKAKKSSGNGDTTFGDVMKGAHPLMAEMPLIGGPSKVKARSPHTGEVINLPASALTEEMESTGWKKVGGGPSGRDISSLEPGQVGITPRGGKVAHI